MVWVIGIDNNYENEKMTKMGLFAWMHNLCMGCVFIAVLCWGQMCGRLGRLLLWFFNEIYWVLGGWGMVRW